MKKFFLILSSIVIPIHYLLAQDMTRVGQYLDTLCAPGLYGRGASFNGQKNAAVYLSDRFREIGLSPLSNSYFQNFEYSINTFPGRMHLQTDQTMLVPGKDYIVEASSPSGKGHMKILLLDTALFSSEKKRAQFLKTNLKKTAVVYDETFVRLLKTGSTAVKLKLREAGCHIELKEKKLTMGLSSVQSAVPCFEVLKEKFDRNSALLSFRIDAKWLKNYTAQNVIGCIKGTSYPDSFLFVTAHYDHLGSLGKNTYFAGANDNGSGVSLLLELAHYFKKNPPRYSLVFIAFAAEEAGLIGSHYFTEHPLVPLTSIRFLVNLDLMGTGEEGMMVVNGALFNKEYEILLQLNSKNAYLPVLKKRGKAANSDHYYFTEKGVPAFFFYTLGGISAYHDVYDLPETLPLTKFKEVHRLMVDFLSLLMQ